MKVKRYVVDTLPDALNKIRQELGKDAVILNTKQVRVGGVLGFFSKKKIEVIAAADEQNNSSERQHKAIADRDIPVVPTVGSTVAAQAYRRAAPSSSAAAVVKDAVSKAPILESLSSNQPAADHAEEGSQPAVQLDVVQQFKRAAAQSIQRSAAKQTTDDPARMNEKLDPQELMAEIKEMKELVVRLSGGIAPLSKEETTSYPAFAAIERRLVQQGVLPSVARDLLQRAMSVCDEHPSEVEDAKVRMLVKEQMLQLFEEHPSSGISDDSRIIQFVGPTGVGKTTTIAKLAAEQVLRNNRQVGFVTTDTYRIAAIDQLKTYATILNVPVEVVFSSEEMKDALDQLSDRQLIFMDTAGRNYRDEKSVHELNELIRSHGQSETYLVLSLVAKYEDIKAIIDNFRHVQVNKVLWTKQDETVSYGSIVNVLHEYSLQPSYITNGQNVPDDISLLHPESIIQQLLGEDAYG